MTEPSPEAVEALARVLRSVGVEIGYAGADTYRTVVAERILADPSPLLAALAQAGVLEVRSRSRVVPVYNQGGRPVDNALVTERSYVSRWEREDA